MASPYARLNLRRNPFGELDPAERARLAVVDLDPLLAWLRPGRALELVGRCGRGKSTHLHALAAALPEAQMARFRRDPVPHAPPVLLLDEADARGPIARWRAWRGAGAVVIATHRSLAWELRLAGFKVRTLPVGGSDTARLAAVFARRVEAVRRGEGAVPQVSAAVIETLMGRFGDDVRGMEELLYRAIEALDAPRPLTPEDLC